MGSTDYCIEKQLQQILEIKLSIVQIVDSIYSLWVFYSLGDFELFMRFKQDSSMHVMHGFS